MREKILCLGGMKLRGDMKQGECIGILVIDRLRRQARSQEL